MALVPTSIYSNLSNKFRKVTPKYNIYDFFICSLNDDKNLDFPNNFHVDKKLILKSMTRKIRHVKVRSDSKDQGLAYEGGVSSSQSTWRGQSEINPQSLSRSITADSNSR